MADLVVGHLPTGNQFWINVKGLSSPTTWLVEVEGKQLLPNLFYILVLVGESRAKDRFFVLSQAEARKLRDAHKASRGGRGSLNPKGFQGFAFRDGGPFEDCWSSLPSA